MKTMSEALDGLGGRVVNSQASYIDLFTEELEEIRLHTTPPLNDVGDWNARAETEATWDDEAWRY